MLTWNGCTFSQWYRLHADRQGGAITVRGSMALNLGGSGTVKALSELVLQFLALRFCSSEKGQKGKKKKKYIGEMAV
jgi:hypothetical protein